MDKKQLVASVVALAAVLVVGCGAESIAGKDKSPFDGELTRRTKTAQRSK
jgi:hypothetical protein